MKNFLLLLVFLSFNITHFQANNLHKKLVEEYSTDFCFLLEEHYGSGMMSEGGSQAIKHMFEGVDLKNKKALDVGSGMGGVPLYLVEMHNMDVTGLEINPWMVQESTKRIPEELQSKLRYVLSTSDDKLDFPDNHFDIVYSKGVLTHLEDKLPLFKELRRVLKPGGVLVINDWLAPQQGKWGGGIQRMMEIEDLTLFAETEKNYIQLLKDAGFDSITSRNDSKLYQKCNEQICVELDGPKKQKFTTLLGGQEEHKTNLEGYQLIAQAFANQDLFSYTFVVQ